MNTKKISLLLLWPLLLTMQPTIMIESAQFNTKTVPPSTVSNLDSILQRYRAQAVENATLSASQPPALTLLNMPPDYVPNHPNNYAQLPSLPANISSDILDLVYQVCTNRAISPNNSHHTPLLAPTAIAPRSRNAIHPNNNNTSVIPDDVSWLASPATPNYIQKSVPSVPFVYHSPPILHPTGPTNTRIAPPSPLVHSFTKRGVAKANKPTSPLSPCKTSTMLQKNNPLHHSPLITTERGVAKANKPTSPLLPCKISNMPPKTNPLHYSPLITTERGVTKANKLTSPLSPCKTSTMLQKNNPLHHSPLITTERGVAKANKLTSPLSPCKTSTMPPKTNPFHHSPLITTERGNKPTSPLLRRKTSNMPPKTNPVHHSPLITTERGNKPTSPLLRRKTSNMPQKTNPVHHSPLITTERGVTKANKLTSPLFPCKTSTMPQKNNPVHYSPLITTERGVSKANKLTSPLFPCKTSTIPQKNNPVHHSPLTPRAAIPAHHTTFAYNSQVPHKSIAHLNPTHPTPPPKKQVAQKKKKQIIQFNKLPKKYSKKTKMAKIAELHNFEQLLCGICWKKFDTQSALSSHYKTHGKNKRYKCVYCPMTFPSDDSWHQHMRTHNGKNPFCCPICKKKFHLQYKLSNHIQTHSDARPFLCPNCPKAYKRVDDLKKHLEAERAQKKGNYTCSSCLAKFSSAHKLKRHQRIHTGEATIICPFCKESFREKRNLTNHLNKVCNVKNKSTYQYL